jgi:hypothetical protein
VINRQDFETHLSSIKLTEYPTLKVYYGGTLSEIPLKEILEVTIDHSKMVQYEDELYYSAKIVLKDGASISPTQKDSKVRPFISVQNSLTGKRGNEIYKIGLQDVGRIEIGQK